MNKLIMTEQERRLNDKMKYSHLGAALLWCLRAHKTMKVYTLTLTHTSSTQLSCALFYAEVIYPPEVLRLIYIYISC